MNACQMTFYVHRKLEKVKFSHVLTVLDFIFEKFKFQNHLLETVDLTKQILNLQMPVFVLPESIYHLLTMDHRPVDVVRNQ